MWKTSTLARISPNSDPPPATTKWYDVAPQPGPRRFIDRLGQESFGSGSAFPFVTLCSRMLCVSFMWIVTKLVLVTLQPHSAGAGNNGPATQDWEPGARMDIPVLWTIKTCSSMVMTLRTSSPRSLLVNMPRSHRPDVTLSARQSVEFPFPIHHPPQTASCGGSMGVMKDPKP